jgi:hypothetical protein
VGVDEGVDVGGGRATRVGGVNCGNSVMASFSEWSRIEPGG